MEAGDIIAIVDCILLVVVVMATDWVVVVVAVVLAICEGLLGVVVAGVWAAVETGGCAVSSVSGSTAEPSGSASPCWPSIDLDSAGSLYGSIEETSDTWLMVPWASTVLGTSSLPVSSCSALSGLTGSEVTPWGWLTEWACVFGSLDGPEELSRLISGDFGSSGGFPPSMSSLEDISKPVFARKRRENITVTEPQVC